MNDPFARSRPAACPSAWRLSRAAAGDLAPAERAALDAHLASCPACADALADEAAAVRAAALEPLPSAIGDLARAAAARSAGRLAPRPWLPWLFPLGGALAAAAAAVLLLTRPADPGDPGATRAKGAATLEATVLRGDQPVITDAPLDALGPLADGDRLRLRARAAANRHARVEGLDAGAWVLLWEGPVPADGWLPFGLTATAGSATALRVALCDAAPADPAAAFRDAGDPTCTHGSWTLDVR